MSRKYNLELYERKQNEIFNSLNFDRGESLQKLIDLKKNINYPVREMSSEHEIIFSAIASKRKSIKYLKLVLSMDGILIYYQSCFLVLRS